MASMLFLLTCMLGFSEASSLQEGANPIRKIVGLLQGMQAELEAEGVKEQAAYDKFMCYCDGNTGSMSDGNKANAQKSATLSSTLADLEAQKSQMDQELKGHHDSRDAATQDLTKANNIRANENEEFVAASTDMAANIKAMKGAVSALEKGAGAFMQMGSEQKARLTQLIEGTSQVDDYEKQSALDFLQGKTSGDYAPQGGQITGMLKSMQEEMEGDLKSAEDSEAASVSGQAELSQAKNAEIAAASAAIESKTVRAGELAVEIVQTRDAKEDTDAEIAETEGFLGNLAAQCAEKKAEWSDRQKMRSEEIAAISMAVKILNDDSALDLFKKTASLVQESGMRFMQKSSSMSKVRRAQAMVASLAKSGSHQTTLSLIAAAMKTSAVDFGKITEMIDGMVGVLKSEQTDDDTQLAFCKSEFDKSAQQKKETESKLASLDASISDMSATAAQLASEIETLTNDIKVLDGAVAQATAQRKSDHAEFTSAQAENQAATELVEKAKNRLYQFYRPNLHVAEERRELSQEEEIAISAGGVDPRDAEEAAAAAQENLPTFVQVRAASDDKAAPPPPPETFGAYSKKSGKSNGVMALMDQMIEELKTDYSDSKHNEEMAQKDYEHLMASSQKSRAQSAKSITEKESARAEWNEKIENSKTEHASTTDALLKLNEFIAGLHATCDFLVENADMRKEARTQEIEGLTNAKAVLSGANME